MQKITSTQNPRIKNLMSLHRSRGRKKQNRIAIFGSREIARALMSGVSAEEIFICESHADPSSVSQIRELITDESVMCSIEEDLFAKVCFGQRHDGLIMTAQRPEQSIELVFEHVPPNALIAVVEAIEKPGNLGAILRSADGAGIDAVLVANPLTDWFHPNAIRSSLGTCFSMPGCVGDSTPIRERLLSQGYRIVVADLAGAKDFYELELTGKTALVLGNEAQGVSDVWRGTSVQAAKLPMLGIADSLNVSASAAVMFYEARRQRSE